MDEEKAKNAEKKPYVEPVLEKRRQITEVTEGIIEEEVGFS